MKEVIEEGSVSNFGINFPLLHVIKLAFLVTLSESPSIVGRLLSGCGEIAGELHSSIITGVTSDWEMSVRLISVCSSFVFGIIIGMCLFGYLYFS